VTLRTYLRDGESVPKFRPKSVEMIRRVNAIITDYQARGFSLTLRQTFYQAVSRGWIDNTQREYKNLGNLINAARHCGLISWTAIEDRTRHLRMSDGVEQTPEEFIAGDADAFRLNYWNTQPYHVEVWVEKDALVDVLANACDPLFVPYYSCRGYTSATELWRAGQRLKRAVLEGKEPLVIHLGDHDPSGIDMTRDIRDRLLLYSDDHLVESSIRRIALTWEQIEQYQPPPNPAKETDSRHAGYSRQYGDESWELDALDPQVLVDLITAEIAPLIDRDAWRDVQGAERSGKNFLRAIGEHAEDLREHARDQGWL
jgi:hypothetical protein